MPQEFKYLAIKNWSKFQPGRTGKSGWIKDYADKEFDAEFMGLSFFQRYVLDGCQRLRGRIGKNILNDATFVARALHAMSTDRPHIRHAIDTLIAHGFLVLTNEQLDKELVCKNKRKSKNKEVEKEKTDCAEASSAQPPAPPLKSVMLLPLNQGKFSVSEEDFKRWKELYPAVDVMQELRKMAAWLDAKPDRRKTSRGVKAFIVSWLSRAQDDPRAAAGFRIEAKNGTRTSKQAERNAGNLEVLISGALGNRVRGNDVHHGRTVQPGIVPESERGKSSVSNAEILAREPAKPKPPADA
jgi:hypothetical protein